MKKIILRTGFIIAIAICPILSAFGSALNEPSGDRTALFIEDPKDTFTLPGENTISLTHDYVSPTMATVYENNVQNMLVNGTSAVSNPAISLNQSNIDTLYGHAYALLLQAKASSSSGNFITAIEIFYGINGSSMSYYFLPVCLQTPGSTNPGATYIYNPTSTSLPQNHNQLYVYNASSYSINTATLSQLSADTAAYAQHMGIIHSCNATPTFIETVNLSNPNADTKYVVFPFQEIFHMMESNNVSGLTMYNIAVPVPIVGGSSNSIRHDLLLAPSPGSGGPVSSPIYDDLAHMVPPDYANLTYTRASN